MQTLYRKYRPADFSEVYGQDVLVKVLLQQLKEGKVGHAYIFAGPRGTGKTSMARLLVKAVNCQNPNDGNPCKKCLFCKAIEKGKFLDLIEIDAASNRGIDEIRRLRERVSFAPSEGTYKVYIIDEVHMLTKDAFNALLKTLEEPPSHVIFILATTESHKILPTILSRCQRFNFSLAAEEVILDRLKYICRKEKVRFSKDALMAIVKNSGGSFRDAESILEKVLGAIGVKKDGKVDLEDVRAILGLAEEREVVKFIQALLKKDVAKSLSIFHSVADSGINLFQFLRQVLEHTRQLLMEKVVDKKGKMKLYDLLGIISHFSEAESRLKMASVERLPIEVAIIKVCGEDDDKEEKKRAHPSKEEGGKISTVVSKAIDLPKKIKSSIKDEGNSKKVSIGEIEKRWGEMIEKIRPFNHHLSAFFKKAQVKGIEGAVLVLQVPFTFHKQRIESMKAREIFSQLSEEFFGVALRCVCEVVQDTQDKSEASEEEAEDVVLEVMGDLLE